MTKAKQKDSRFSKEHWIEKALEFLSQTGGAKIHIEKLAAKLGVTKGSFYWHFESRNDFIDQVLTYWEERSTANVIKHVQEQQFQSAKEAITYLANYLVDNDLLVHDMPVRSWAVQESRVQQRVEANDNLRKEFVTSALINDGIDEQTAIMFTSHFTCFAQAHGFILPSISKEELRQRLLWLIETSLP
jgi:AcrR family transcriptional regulator